MRIKPKPANECDFRIKYVRGVEWTNLELPYKGKIKELEEVAELVAEAVNNNKTIILMMGAHPIKVGLTPKIRFALQRFNVSHLAVNGAFIIHDVEMALFGKTSEDVEYTLKDGQFGLCDETANFIFDAVSYYDKSFGFGMSLVHRLHNNNSIFNNFPYTCDATIHTAFGADTIHYHPKCPDKILIEALRTDLDILCNSVSRLQEGVVINVGSAVILPEVFMKCLNTVRNNGYKVDNFTAINFDMISHYRPNKNILERTGAKGYEFIGYHEIMFPLFVETVSKRLKGE